MACVGGSWKVGKAVGRLIIVAVGEVAALEARVHWPFELLLAQVKKAERRSGYSSMVDGLASATRPGCPSLPRIRAPRVVRWLTTTNYLA